MEDELICKDHSQAWISYCRTCRSNICKMCIPVHEGHDISSVVKKEDEEAKIERCRRLRVQFDHVVLAIERKRIEFILEQIDIRNKLRAHFTAMEENLTNKRTEMIQEARRHYDL